MSVKLLFLSKWASLDQNIQYIQYKYTVRVTPNTKYEKLIITNNNKKNSMECNSICYLESPKWRRSWKGAVTWIHAGKPALKPKLNHTLHIKATWGFLSTREERRKIINMCWFHPHSSFPLFVCLYLFFWLMEVFDNPVNRLSHSFLDLACV